jgi:hypothetical protein
MTPVELRWGIKASFREYISSISDGVEELRDGAALIDGVFAFPRDDAASLPPESAAESEYRFRGRVDLTGYDGLLGVRIQDPWLQLIETSWSLSVVDPAYRGDTSRRIRVCSLDREPGPYMSDGTAVFAARLDGTATRLFDGVYAPGTRLDSVTVVFADTRVSPKS